MKQAVAALVLLLNTCALAQVVPVKPPTAPFPIIPSFPIIPIIPQPPTGGPTLTRSAVTTTTIASDPSPSPGYVLKEYSNGTATVSAAFDPRVYGGCITRFHIDSDEVPQFENDRTLCGQEKDMTTQFTALFNLNKYDDIRGRLNPDGTYEIRVHSITPERRDGPIKRKYWSFLYQGVGAVVPSSSSSVPPSTSASATSSSQSAAASTSKVAESPAPTKSAATESATESVAPSSQAPAPSNNLYKAGASTASALTLAGVAAMALLF
ncbi:hypothetical protein HDU81_001946 [Chytriomyces hyalinus]|nr:hypothetical protein HDU81_001941 [Chytriomyces hyalinus]KAJ3233883.1 hypothetical protein HDU81_001946 [Chytriomyces hyalinus]